MVMNWKTMPLAHKIATVISWIAVAVWLIGNLKPDLFPIDLTYPAVAVFTLCEAVVYWEKKRKWAYLLIAGTVVMMACFVLELLLL